MNARAQRYKEQRQRTLTMTAMRAAPRWTPELDAQVIETGGRYRNICALAAKLNLASATVQARWHVVRGR